MTFEHDPNLGKIKLITDHISQLTIVGMYKRLYDSLGVPAAIESIHNLGFGAYEEPFEITVITPRILLVLNRTLLISELPVRIIRHVYVPPDCESLELSRRLNAFLQTNLPEFLEPIADEYFTYNNQDPFKIAQQLFVAGLEAPIDVSTPHR